MLDVTPATAVVTAATAFGVVPSDINPGLMTFNVVAPPKVIPPLSDVTKAGGAPVVGSALDWLYTKIILEGLEGSN